MTRIKFSHLQTSATGPLGASRLVITAQAQPHGRLRAVLCGIVVFCYIPLGITICQSPLADICPGILADLRTQPSSSYHGRTLSSLVGVLRVGAALHFGLLHVDCCSSPCYLVVFSVFAIIGESRSAFIHHSGLYFAFSYFQIDSCR